MSHIHFFLQNTSTDRYFCNLFCQPLYVTEKLLSENRLNSNGSTLLSTGVGTAICAPTGPVAILCGVTAGLVTWFSVDKALVELDEAMNREEMRADIMAVLDEQRQILTGQLIDRHVVRIDRMAEHVDRTVERLFIPASDGLDPR